MSENSTDRLVLGPVLDRNVPALAFGVALIVVVVGGNALVCASVCAERALKTTTNYFIVSLAVSDLLLALLVLPLFVYAEFQGGVWSLNMAACDVLMAMDVMLCTASIFNLCAIGVDRFIAVSVPLNYNRRHVDQRQVALLCATWLLALAVASPLLFGVNDVPGREPGACRLEDAAYVVYSSACSFFVPCPLMLLLYAGVFRGLRRWEEARKARLHSSIEACRRLQHAAPRGPATASTAPLPRVVERDLAQTRQDEAGGAPEVPYPRRYREDSVPAVTFRGRAKINNRERKAMRVLPVVVGCFLLCWTPFFATHTARALCATCHVPPRLMSSVTWLGYVNSALNPVIYTVFNAEFRKVFARFLAKVLRRPPCC